LDIDIEMRTLDEVSVRAELLLLSPSVLVPSLQHGDIKIWDTIAIAEYLCEIRPEAQLLPSDCAQRAHCRSISGEMHGGFANLRSALPMNVKARYPGFHMWEEALADVDRIQTIWSECLRAYGGPYLFGERLSIADAMYAPVCTRFTTYDVRLEPACDQYRRTILELPAMVEWIALANAEPDELEELDMEF
jgi:glutathione S-transferase